MTDTVREQRPSTERMTTVALVVLLVVGLMALFEAALWLTAAVLFTHIDTQVCAGPDPFCRPSGRPGLTGGAGVIIGGHLGALLVATPLVMLTRWRVRRGSATTSGRRPAA